MFFVIPSKNYGTPILNTLEVLFKGFRNPWSTENLLCPHWPSKYLDNQTRFAAGKLFI